MDCVGFTLVIVSDRGTVTTPIAVRYLVEVNRPRPETWKG